MQITVISDFPARIFGLLLSVEQQGLFPWKKFEFMPNRNLKASKDCESALG
jgi:hypothetical protein